MNVLMTVDTLGEAFTCALELAGALGRQGVQIALATKGAVLSPDQWCAARRVPGLEIFESSDRPEWTADPWEDVARSSAWLLDLAEALRPDVVHLNDYAHGALPFEAPTVVVGHSCVYSWYEAVRGSAPPSSFLRYRREVARGLAAAGVVVAPTRWMLDELRRHYGELPRARVIPDGRSASRFHPREKEPLILCTGPRRDPAANAAALDLVCDRLPWPVLLAGEDQPPDVHRAGRSHRRRAHALGRLSPEALVPFYERAAIYALPARYAPFGLSVLEAALAGCALVLGDIPGLRETWSDAAVFVDPDSPDAIRATLCGLADQPERCSSLGERARARALALAPSRMAASYLDAYRALLAERSDGLGAPSFAS
jgi:glycosyltransferase involved in cell wall biosynthesis